MVYSFSASTDVPSPSAVHSPNPAFDDRSLDGFSSLTTLPLHQVPTSSSSGIVHPSKRRPTVSSTSTSRDRNFSSSSSLGGSTAARLLADFMNCGDNDVEDSLVDEDATDLDDDYDDLSADDDNNDRTSGFSRAGNAYWELRKFPLEGDDLDDLGLENGEMDDEDVWFGNDVRIVDGGIRSRFASETAATSPFRKAEVTSRSASLDRASASTIATGAGGDATSTLHQNGDGKIAPPLTPSSTSGWRDSGTVARHS